MGYRKVPIIYTLELGGEHKGLVVRMKSMKVGAMRKIVRLLESDDESTTEMIDAMVNEVHKGIVSWNYEEEDGTPIEPTLEAIDDLDFDLLKDILDEWLSNVTGPNEELGKDSANGSRFPGQPVTMEAL